MDPDIFQAPEETRFKSQGSTRVLAVIALPALMSFYLAYVVKGWYFDLCTARVQPFRALLFQQLEASQRYLYYNINYNNLTYW